MASKDFNIFAALRLRNATQFQREFRTIAASVGKARAEVGKLTAGLRGIGGSVLGLAGIGGLTYGVSSLVRQLVTVPAAVDDAKRSLAVLVQQSFGIADWDRATDAATRLRERLREIAAVSPGTLDDYMESVRDLAVVAKGTGASLEDLARLTQTVVATTKVGGYQSGVVGRDIRQLLGGQGSVAQIQVATLKPIANEVAALARAGQKAEALRRIVDALQISPGALASFEKSLDAQITTLQTSWQQFLESAGAPLVADLVTRLKTVNTWIAANQAKVAEYAKAVGGYAIKAVNGLVRGVKWLANNWEGIVTTVKTLATVWIGVKLFDGITALTRAAIALGVAMKTAFTGAAAPLALLLGKVGVVAGAALALTGDTAQRPTTGGVRDVNARSFESQIQRAARAAPGSQEETVALTLARRIGLREQARIRQAGIETGQGPYAHGVTREAQELIVREQIRAGLQKARGEVEQRARETAILGEIKSAAEAGLVANIDQRGARIEVRQDFRQADPDAVFFEMSRDVARASLRVVSPYSPGGR